MTNKVLYSIIGALLVVAAGFFALQFISSGEQSLKQPVNQAQEQPKSPENQIPDTMNDNTSPTSSPQSSGAPQAGKIMAEIKVKNFGSIKLELDEAAAPKTVANFVKLASEGFYNGLTFHRVAKEFVIQGGDPKGDGTGGPGYTVPAEIKLLHKKGAIAMARLSDQVNPGRDSSGSQFYIALNELTQLDGQYTVFGYVAEGMDVAEKIGKVEIDSPYGDGSPKEKVVIESVKILK